VPDGSGNIKVSKSEMMTGGGLLPLDFNKTGNIITWQEYVEKNSTLPLIYSVEYIVDTDPKASTTGTFSKKLVSPPIINYRYIGKPGLSALILKINKSLESSITLFDENRNEISEGEADETGDIIRFGDPQFKELNIEISRSSVIPAMKNDNSVYVYVAIGILILLVLLYPYISKKLKQDKSGKNGKGTSKSYADKSKEERSRPGNNSMRSKEELKGELDPMRKELGLKLKDLETKYKSGDLLDEEYEEEKKTLQNKLLSLNKQSK
jgi:hypothetical protein